MKKRVRLLLNSYRNLLLEFLMPSLARQRCFKKIDSTNLTTLKNNRVSAVEPELLCISDLIKRGKAVVDVGSNQGAYLHVLERSGKFSPIIGIEPNLKLSKRLKRLFPRCIIFNVGLSDASETKKLKIPIIDGKPMASRGTFETFTDIGETDSIHAEVLSSTLDNLVKENAIQDIGFLKIDVEGHELNVIQGGSLVIQHDQPIMLIEVAQRHHQEPIENIFRQILSYGYRGYFLNLPGLCFVELQNFSIDKHQQISQFKTPKYHNNFLFIPSESSLSLKDLNNTISVYL